MKVPEDYIRECRGEGLAVLCVHGNGVDHRNLLMLDEALERLGGLQRIYIDLPGFGGTTPLSGRGGLPDYARWLTELVARTLGKRQFALVGQSMGALLAQDVADQFAQQVVGLALLAPVVYPDREQRLVPAPRVLEEDGGLMDSLNARQRTVYKTHSVLRTAQNWDRFNRFVMPGIAAVDLRAMVKLSKGYALDPLPVNRPGTLPFPVLAVCGLLDHVVGYHDAGKLARRYSNFSVELIADAGHNLHIDQPQLVMNHLYGWGREVKNFAAEIGRGNR